MTTAQERYWVQGGVYTDGSFATLDPAEPPELYGPFDTQEEAEQVWLGRTQQRIDICWHKLFVVKTQGTEPPPGRG